MATDNRPDPFFENPPPRTVVSTLRDAYELGIYSVLRHAPIDVASDVGSAIVRWSVPRNRPWIIKGARRNLRILRPDLEPEAIDSTINSFLDNVGRLMAEFSVLHRLCGQGRIELSPGMVALRASLKRRDEPTLALVLHTGNWEVLAADLHHQGITCTTFAEPPQTWAQRFIASKVRRSLGMHLLHGDVRGLGAAREELAAGGLVSIFGDEAKAGRSMSPLFGRQPHREGNLAAAAWLARRTDARIFVCHVRRIYRSRFYVDGSAPFRLGPATKRSNDQILEDVAALNEVVEPIIRANLDQWYFLDDRID